MKVTENKKERLVMRMTEDDMKLLKMASICMGQDSVSGLIRMMIKPCLLNMKKQLKEKGMTIDEAFNDLRNWNDEL